MDQEEPIPLEDRKVEYKRLKAEIIANFGEPVLKDRKPANEAAKKLYSLRALMAQRARNNGEQKKLSLEAKALKRDSALPIDVPVPPEILLPFNEIEQNILKEYFRYSEITTKEIAKNLGTTSEEVFKFVNSKPFMTARQQVLEYFKESLPYEAIVALRTCIRSKEINTQKLNAALAILEDSGFIKGKAGVELNIYEKTEDPLVEEELRKLGDKLANRPIIKRIPNGISTVVDNNGDNN